jgi:hypothetical protein
MAGAAADGAAPPAPAPSWASGPNAFGISLDSELRSPLPVGVDWKVAVPALWMWRTVGDAVIVADALVAPVARVTAAAATATATTATIFLAWLWIMVLL